MRMCGRGVWFAVAMLGLSVVACGDDNGKPSDGDDEVAADSGEQVRRPDGGGLDASRGLDGARADARSEDEPDGASALEDGAVEPADDDAAVDDGLDAQVDAAAADASADAAEVELDAHTPADASSTPDANDASDASDANLGSCEVDSPLYGCGRQVSDNWFVFESGLSIDRVSHQAWSAPLAFTNLNDLYNKCEALAVGGLSTFVVPQIGEARTFADGCDKTEWVNGSFAGKCSVMYGEISAAHAGSCSCDGATGPKDGKFCQVGSPICDTLWTYTSCGASCGDVPQTWFYDVDTGEIVLSKRDEGIALTAKGRCVAYVNDTQLP